MNISISANAVAWYGAIVATASVVGGGLEFWRDRAQLKVSARADMTLLQPFEGYSADETYIFIEVANVGRRPINLRQLPFFTRKGEKTKGLLVTGSWLPKDQLQEGESAAMLAKQDGLDLSLLTGVVVNDATGRVWKGKIRRK